MKKTKRILTLEDLVLMCQEQHFTKFSTKESGYKLAVHVPAQFEINQEQNDDSLLFCTVKLMHSGENRNHSSVTDDALIKCSKTLAYKPILANFMEYTDEKTGQVLKDFTSHDMEFNKDGSVTYLEKQVGCFTADEPYFEVEKDTGHNFLYGYCAIPKVYTDACEIIERKNGTKVSVELEINEFQYNAAQKVLELSDVIIMGATLLGKNAKTLKDVEEGMKNARLDISDFSTEKNSIQFSTDEKIFELLENINSNIVRLSGQFSNTENQKGGDAKNMNKFEELLEKYGKTEEDIDFEYSDLSDEELESKFAEVFGNEVETKTENESETENGDETETGTENAETDNNDDENEDSEVGTETTVYENLVRSFEISHEDIRYALYNLLAPYEEADNEWYYVNSVYDDYFSYENWNGTKIFGQKYTKDGDNVAFDGERYNLHRELLTDSEYAELKSMRENYADLAEFKETVEKNELHAKREEVINSEKYAALAEKDENGKYVNEAFAELVENIDNYSLTDLETQIKVIHSDYVSANAQFEHKEDNAAQKNKVGVKVFSTLNGKSKPKKRYGNLFDQLDEEHNKK